jgi:vancomycin permeability regulator SanA
VGLTTALTERLNTGIECYRAHPETTAVIVTGGDPQALGRTEAEAMSDYLIDNGVKAEHILEEKEARYALSSSMPVGIAFVESET